MLADFAILLAYIILLSGTALQRAAGDLVLSALLLLGVAVVGAGYALWGLLG